MYIVTGNVGSPCQYTNIFFDGPFSIIFLGRTRRVIRHGLVRLVETSAEVAELAATTTVAYSPEVTDSAPEVP
jgi:hypothetical protein